MRQIIMGNTVQYASPTWSGDGFLEPDAQGLWDRLASPLKRIVIAEVGRGNSTRSILLNKDRDLVLLSLTRGR